MSTGAAYNASNLLAGFRKDYTRKGRTENGTVRTTGYEKTRHSEEKGYREKGI